jgi:protein involved in polysaccharide export with SLBB domain
MNSSCNKNLRSALLVLCALALTACSSSSDSRGDRPDQINSKQAAMMNPEACLENGATVENASLDTRGYQIQPGDQLAIDFYLNSEFNDNVSVQPDGRVVLRLVGPLHAAGLSPGQLATEINQAYAKELKNPSATVHVQNMPNRQIFVQGQVNHPGAFSLQPGMTAMQAIADAGGQTDEAELSDVVLIRRDACGRADGSKVNLASATDSPDKGEDVMLMPRDTLVVPRSRIANMDLFVKQYIRDMLPVQPYLSPSIP